MASRPQAYLMAVWWRICGKRVRARAQMAPLLGSSANAYRLWLLREHTISDQSPSGPPIVALVDMTLRNDRSQSIDETLHSLAAEGIDTVPLYAGDSESMAAATSLIDWTRDPWLLLIAPGDVLRAGAASAYRNAVGDAHKVVYADDDLLDRRGNRRSPHFKPEWNSELFGHFDFLTGACIVRASKADLAACSGPEWMKQLIANAVASGEPLHLPLILHHRHHRPEPQVPCRCGKSARELPTVTVIIPTRNRADLLDTCLSGLNNTDYPLLDIIVVDNESDAPETLAYLESLPPKIRVLRHPGPFNFSAMNNRAARLAKGQLLCLLNNDIEVIEPNWLKVMAAQAVRDDVGAVGAHLLYPDGRTQHAGVVTGIGGGAAHAHRLIYPDEEGYFQRHILPQFVSAVTAACLVIRRDRFNSVEGFDEKNFAVAFNDVDLCLRLNQRGWQSLYEPRARLIHHESVSRGIDRDPVGSARLACELAALKAIWRTDTDRDPFHHANLSRFSERFVVQF